jgi:hypothetical protein
VSVGFTVVVTVVGEVTVTVVTTGVVIVGDGAMVVLVGTAVVGDGVTVVVFAAMVVCEVAIVVVLGATVVWVVVTLSAPTGSTMRIIEKNTITGMSDDPLVGDIEKILPAGYTGDIL